MPSLKELQAVVPTADVVAGSVVAFHEGKHIDLGRYVGEGHVELSKAGEELMAPAPEPAAPAKPGKDKR